MTTPIKLLAPPHTKLLFIVPVDFGGTSSYLVKMSMSP